MEKVMMRLHGIEGGYEAIWIEGIEPLGSYSH